MLTFFVEFAGGEPANSTKVRRA
ncbi:MAG: hypothetical protein V7636_103, partial [Actinomycetota bacterium]